MKRWFRTVISMTRILPLSVAQLQHNCALGYATGGGQLRLGSLSVLHDEVGQHFAQFQMIGMDVDLGQQVHQCPLGTILWMERMDFKFGSQRDDDF